MKTMIEKLMAFAARHLPGSIAFLVALFVFTALSNLFITEKGIFGRLLAPVVGFVGGLFGGGILGWTIGGIGVAAMGTAVGIGALGAILIAGVSGAILGTLTGATFSFFRMLRSPSNFEVNWIAFILVLLGALAVFFVVRKLAAFAIRHIPPLARRLLPL